MREYRTDCQLPHPAGDSVRNQWQTEGKIAGDDRLAEPAAFDPELSTYNDFVGDEGANLAGQNREQSAHHTKPRHEHEEWSGNECADRECDASCREIAGAMQGPANCREDLGTGGQIGNGKKDGNKRPGLSKAHAQFIPERIEEHSCEGQCAEHQEPAAIYGGGEAERRPAFVDVEIAQDGCREPKVYEKRQESERGSENAVVGILFGRKCPGEQNCERARRQLRQRRNKAIDDDGPYAFPSQKIRAHSPG
jgi:hypothetical protein